MRILHVCLAAFYVDGYGYQENVLPKIHKKNGHEVEVLASCESYGTDLKRTYLVPGAYVGEDDIPVHRVPYHHLLPLKIAKKLRVYRGLRSILNRFSPEIIILHDCQFLSIRDIVWYAQRNICKIVADCHTDYINSARGWLSKEILHGWLYRYCHSIVEPYTKWFYGTLPARCTFLEEVYHIPREKIKLLPFGADDTVTPIEDRENIRKRVRDQMGIKSEEFVIISGGKIDKRKEIENLILAFRDLRIRIGVGNIKLVIFGKPTQEMKLTLQLLKSDNDINYLGWKPSQLIPSYFLASDLAVFPGTHSVLWEEAAGLGVPLVVRRWPEMCHINYCENCRFLENGSVGEIVSVVKELVDDRSLFTKIRKNALRAAKDRFSYSQIAASIIEE